MPPGYASKILFMMKVTIFVLLATLLQVKAVVTMAQRVTLDEKNASLLEVIKKIRIQSGYDFAYNEDLTKHVKGINVSIKNGSVEAALEQVLKNLPLTYIIENKLVVIIRRPAVSPAEPAQYQDSLIRGKVIDEQTKQPIPGVTLRVDGGRTAQTGPDGSFKISAQKGSVIVFSYIGYESRDYKIDAKTKEIVIRLALKNNSLDEVVVGTGIYKRPVENFTGSAKIITAEELKRIAPSNILSAISILDPSFRLPEDINLGSDPNRLPDIELRGQNNFPDQGTTTATSTASLRNVFGDKPNAPLFVLDGFQVTLQRVFDLDMNRVERITILKDAAATAIYGSRASNGVVVIDTRQPKEGSVRISYRGGITITAPDISSYDLLNAAEKLAFEKEVGFYSDSAPSTQELRDEEYNERLKDVTRGVNTYWLSKPLQTGYGNNHSLYLEGGDKVVRYGINLNSSNERAVMKGSGRGRTSGGVNLSYRNSTLLFGNDLSINNVKGTNSPYGSFREYTRLNQYWSPYDEDGQLVRFLGQPRRPPSGTQYTYYGNPLYNAVLPTKNFNEQLGFTNNFKFEWSVVNWLRLMGGVGYTHNNLSSENYVSASNTAFESLPITERGRYDKSTGKTNLIDANLGFDIRKTWKKNLVFVTGNVNANQGKEETYSTSVVGFPNEKVAELIFGSKYAPATQKPSGSQGISRLISGRMNANYSYANKYLIDMSVSVDASSQFGKDRSAAPFWSAGIGWNLHREKFLEGVKFISFLKIRSSIGTTGDQNFPPYMALSTYSYYSDQYYLNQLSAYLMGYGNSGLGWQKSLKRSIGADITMWNNRISVSGDFYYNTTNDLILDITTPPSLGFSSYKENSGALKNIGWQNSINIIIIQKPKEDIYWRAGLSTYGNKNVITKISNSLKKTNDLADASDNTINHPDRKKPKSYYKEGESLTALYAVKSLGIDPTNGQELYLDKDGNATYVWNSEDKVSIGDTRAKVSGTLSTGIDYKGFGFNIYMSFRLGADLYNQTLVDRVENADITYNLDRRVMEERWRKPGDQVFFKGIIGSDQGKAVVENTLATSRFIQKEYMIDASRVSFTYQFPEGLKWLKQLHLSNTRLELYMANPFQISTIKRERGLDYPFANSFTFNISTSIF